MSNPQIEALAREWGIHFTGAMDIMPEEYRRNAQIAMDAQPALFTQPSSGIPAYLTQWVDPEVIRILQTPMKGAEIMGEVRKGDWLTDTAMFTVVEPVGEVSSYGDFNNNGIVNANVNFPYRQSYLYQTITRWGEREAERMGLARLGWVQELNAASALVLNKFQNKTYFYGVAGLQNYGLLNDPGLTAPIQPGPKAFGALANGPWVTNGVVTATANEVFTDIQSLYMRLVNQSGGLIDQDTKVTLALSPASSIALTATNSFNVNVTELLKQNFPALRVVTAVEYATAAGNLVQMIAQNLDGQNTGYVAFNEKMRAHPVVTDLSAFTQKKSAGTWGAIVLQPFAIAQMLGV